MPIQNYPKKIFIETTTRCNMKCFLCVKQNTEKPVADADFSFSLFRNLLSALNNCQVLVLNGIGEPLLNPDLEKFIKEAKKVMPTNGWVGFQTNGQLMTNLRALSLVNSGIDKVCISIDSITPKKFEKIRDGGDMGSVEMAISSLHRAMKDCDRPDVSIGVEFVVMKSNLDELPELVEWVANKNINFIIVTHLHPYSKNHAEEALYTALSEDALELYQKWREIGLKQSVDINNYYKARWEFNRSPENQKIVALVESMKKDAAEMGIMLDLKKLALVEYETIGKVSRIFTNARKIAEKHSIELNLPSIALKEKRSCQFVENDSAFIAVNGQVSPCYFLWHNFNSFASNWPQSIKTVVFGTVAESDLMTIWNKKEYKNFREKVIEHEFPSCANCTLSPCDYLQNQPFEQDCHIQSIPCGACLWSSGLFNCLN